MLIFIAFLACWGVVGWYGKWFSFRWFNFILRKSKSAQETDHYVCNQSRNNRRNFKSCTPKKWNDFVCNITNSWVLQFSIKFMKTAISWFYWWCEKIVSVINYNHQWFWILLYCHNRSILPPLVEVEGLCQKNTRRV